MISRLQLFVKYDGRYDKVSQLMADTILYSREHLAVISSASNGMKEETYGVCVCLQ